MKRICVYCGAQTGNNSEYLKAAKMLGTLFNAHGIGLIYGGSSMGIMGEIAKTVLDGGGEVIGVIPRVIADIEKPHETLTNLHIVESMHHRKAVMSELADGFIALPGGWGTLDELFEIITWAKIGLHRKPCGLLNVAGYYDHLLSFLDQSVQSQFVKSKHHELLLVDRTPEALLNKMLT
jgi:uncharacterized protein (TIGR00730 family)